MMKVNKRNAPGRLARRINFGTILETKGRKAGTALWAGGMGLLGQQLLSEKTGGVLPLVGLGGVLAGVPLMKYSTNAGTKIRTENLLKLIGKKRIALSTAKRVTSPRVRAILLLIASARSESEREAIKTMLTDRITPECGRTLVPVARRAIALEDTTTTRQFHKMIRGYRGIEGKRLDFVAKKIDEEIGKGEIRDDYSYNKRLKERAAPYALSHAMDFFKITNPAFGRQFSALQKIKIKRLEQKTSSTGELDLQKAAQDIIIHETVTELDKLLQKNFGSRKNINAFMTYYQQALAQSIEYINEKIVLERTLREMRQIATIR